MEDSRNFFEDDVHAKMKLADFMFEIPDELIAQFPLKKRDKSRMMVLDRQTRKYHHRKFSNMTDYLEEGDCLVINNTRVFPARLVGVKDKTGAKVEVFLLRNLENGIWEVMVKPARKVRLGNKIVFSDQFSCDIIDNTISGGRIIEVQCNGDFNKVLEEVGQTPLPPYIKREPVDEDRETYQTVYAKERGAVAAPTAGLHMTREILKKLKDKGVRIAPVTLHVGMGTFRPVQVDDVSRHQMHSEYYRMTEESAEIINETKRAGKNVVAIGTTSVRVLETVCDREGFVRLGDGWTDKFIFPPHQFRTIDRLITNFHQPESTLLMLVSAFAGHEFVLGAYQEAIKESYRFFSYGDCMMII